MYQLSNVVRNYFSLRKKPKRLLLFIALVSIVLYISLYSSNMHSSYLSNINIPTNFKQPVLDDKDLACHIHKLDPFDPAIIQAHVEKREDNLKYYGHCESIYPVLFTSSIEPYPRLIPVKNETEMLDKFSILGCCYRIIQRDNSMAFDWPDYSTTFSPECYPISLKAETKVKPLGEFISIECQHERPFIKMEEGKRWVPPENEKNTIVDMHAFIGQVSRKTEKVTKNKNEKINVLVLGLASMARNNFRRSFENSHDYLVNTLHALDMEMYNKIEEYSMLNLGSLLTNLPSLDKNKLPCEKTLAFDNCPFVWKTFAASGYATMFAEDDKALGIFHQSKNGFHNPPTQYYFRPFISTADKYIGREKLLSSKMCYGPRLSFQVWLDYLQKHTIAMNRAKRNYFQFTWSSSVTHDFLNAGSLLDQHLHIFLEWLGQSGYLNNTMLIVMGDRGARWDPIHGLYQGQLEERLPAMYIVLPQSFRTKYKQAYANMIANQRRLVTVWDLHQTLLDVLHLENITNDGLVLREASHKEPPRYAPGISMFLPISKTRTCPMAGISDNYCACNHIIAKVSTEDKQEQQGAKLAVPVELS